MALRQVHHVDVVMHATATWLTMGNRLLGIPLGSSPMRPLGWAPTAGPKALLQLLAASQVARSAGL